MKEYIKEALQILKAQAKVRPMNKEEIAIMLSKLVRDLRKIDLTVGQDASPVPPTIDPKKTIKEKSITCLECGRKYKILTRKHLVRHGLTPAQYKVKYGLPKKASLVCKSLSRARSKEITKLKVWEKRKDGNGRPV